MAVVAPANDMASSARQMSSDFLARRKLYEQGQPTIFYSTVTKVAATGTGSDKFSNATPKPIVRRDSGSSTPVEALPRIRSTESLRRNSKRLSYEVRPDVPRRSSSIRSKQSRKHRASKELHATHRQSVQLFSSLDESVSQHEPAVVDMESIQVSAVVGHPNLHEVSAGLVLKTTDTTNFYGHPEPREDSPWGFTLARKRTSLPSIDAVSDRQVSQHEPRLAERDSCISHRDRESFLASFPQPPRSAISKPVNSHRRNSSSQNYSLFPRGPTKCEVTVEESSPRPSISQSPQLHPQPEILEALPSLERKELAERNSSSLQRQGIAAERLLSGFSLSHSNVSFSNPDFSDASLRLHLDASSTQPVSRTSPMEGLKEQTQVDATQLSRKKPLWRVAPRWIFGSSDTDRSGFPEKPDKRGMMENGNVSRLCAEETQSIPSISGAHHIRLDEKSGFERESDLKTTLGKQAISVSGASEADPIASTNTLLKNRLVLEKPKKSFLKRLACF